MSEALTVKARLTALEQKVAQLEKDVAALKAPAPVAPFVPTHPPLGELPEDE